MHTTNWGLPHTRKYLKLPYQRYLELVPISVLYACNMTQKKNSFIPPVGFQALIYLYELGKISKQ